MNTRVLASVVLCGLALAGCGGKSNPPSATPTLDTSVGPSTTADTEPGASPAATKTSAGGGGNPAAPTYPKTARDYAQALLLAFGEGDKGRVNQLAAQSAVLQLAPISGLDPNWTVYVSCQAEGGSHTVCIFRNAHGDVGSVRMANAQLGHPTAVVDALIEKTKFPSDATAYAQAFGLAWQDRNTERMRRLSSSSVVSFFQGKTPATGYTAYPSVDGDFWKVNMNGSPAGAYSFNLRIAKASLGKPNAIVAASAT